MVEIVLYQQNFPCRIYDINISIDNTGCVYMLTSIRQKKINQKDKLN